MAGDPSDEPPGEEPWASSAKANPQGTRRREGQSGGMSFFLVSVAVAVAVALLAGGSLRSILDTRLEATWSLFLALGLQIALDVFWRDGGSGLGSVLLILSYGLLVGFCFANMGLKGMTVVAIGI